MSHKIIEVQKDDDGQRLDRWLKREVPSPHHDVVG